MSVTAENFHKSPTITLRRACKFVDDEDILSDANSIFFTLICPLRGPDFLVVLVVGIPVQL